jgi:hypothetical protein
MEYANNVSVASPESNWELLLDQLEQLVGKRPTDLNAVLFLIGVQELGRGPKRFTKEQKQDLLHIAVCRVLSLSGYYQHNGLDAEGWPIWTLSKPIPSTDLTQQEDFIKMHVIRYFEQTLTF